jgi:hypothetical protein
MLKRTQIIEHGSVEQDALLLDRLYFYQNGAENFKGKHEI